MQDSLTCPSENVVESSIVLLGEKLQCTFTSLYLSYIIVTCRHVSYGVVDSAMFVLKSDSGIALSMISLCLVADTSCEVITPFKSLQCVDEVLIGDT